MTFSPLTTTTVSASFSFSSSFTTASTATGGTAAAEPLVGDDSFVSTSMSLLSLLERSVLDCSLLDCSFLDLVVDVGSSLISTPPVVASFSPFSGVSADRPRVLFRAGWAMEFFRPPRAGVVVSFAFVSSSTSASSFSLLASPSCSSFFSSALLSSTTSIFTTAVEEDDSFSSNSLFLVSSLTLTSLPSVAPVSPALAVPVPALAAPDAPIFEASADDDVLPINPSSCNIFSFSLSCSAFLVASGAISSSRIAAQASAYSFGHNLATKKASFMGSMMLASLAMTGSRSDLPIRPAEPRDARVGRAALPFRFDLFFDLDGPSSPSSSSSPAPGSPLSSRKSLMMTSASFTQ